MSTYVGLCDKCGYFKIRTSSQLICPVCNEPLKDTRLETTVFCKMSKEDEQQFIEDFMGGKTLDPYWVNKREEYLENWRANNRRQSEEFNRNHPECPYCHKRNTWRISTSSRLLSVGFWGLGSKKIGKQWQCKNCNSYF